jgi:hypothetical protein
LDDPLEQRIFHVPEGNVVTAVLKRSKENKEKAKDLWEDNKKYFCKIWARIPPEKRDIFISKLLTEMWDILEPYSMTSRDMKAMIMSTLPLSALLGEISEADDAFGRVLEGYFKDKSLISIGAPVCRAIETDSPSIDNAINTTATSDARNFTEAFRELSFSMFIIQVTK